MSNGELNNNVLNRISALDINNQFWAHSCEKELVKIQTRHLENEPINIQIHGLTLYCMVRHMWYIKVKPSYFPMNIGGSELCFIPKTF